MSRLTLISFSIYILSIITYINAEGYYSITAPGTLRPNSEYHVAVSVHKSEEPSSIKLDIVGPKFTDSKTVQVQPFSTELVKFDIPKITHGEYNLTAEGVSGLKFKNTTSLNFDGKKYAIFIQTDKALYKPGDLVRYAVIVLDRNVKPFELQGPVNIDINDGKQNRIKQLKDVQLTYGVYRGELQLSAYPVLGKWSIDVDADGEREEKNFDIEEYVLPKFEVTIDTPKHPTFRDEKLYTTIRAKYTYGKPVKGEAIVTFANKYYGYGKFEELLNKTIPIDGKGRVEIDMKKDLKLKRRHLWTRDFTITAVVEEKLTGIKLNTTKDVTIHGPSAKIESVNFPSYYEPNVPFNVTVKVVDHDNKPILDSTNSVLIRVVNPDECVEIVKSEMKLNGSGMATAQFTLPVTEDGYAIRAKYLDVNSYLGELEEKPLEKAQTDEDRFSVNIKTEKATLDKEISVEVKANETMKYFVYQIVGRGDILESKLIEVPDRKYHVFKFKPTFEMVPGATLFVYMIQDGKLVFDEKYFSFHENLTNFVKIDIPAQAKPGEEIDIKVSTKPNSYIGLLGVDQSVILLKSGNEITKDGVFSKLRDFSTNTPRLDGYGRYPGRNAGVVTLTNADYPFTKYLPSPAYFANRVGGLHTTTLQSDFVEKAGFSAQALVGGRGAITVRKEFPETWLWVDTFANNTEGVATIHEKVPDTITSWVVSGYSIDPISGIGLTKAPRKLQVFQPFFVTTNLPYSVKRGEVIAIPVVVFNYMDQDLDAELTLDNEDQEFEFVELDNEISENDKPELKRSKRVAVPSNEGQSVSFMVRPKKVGSIKIKVTGVTPIAGDAFERSLLVEPEGVTEYVNKAFLVDLRKNSEDKKDVAIEVPDNAVPDSTHIEVSVVGDILGPTIKNLDKLVRIPYGCGEQNMVNFVPNILVLKYLGHIGQLTPDIESKAKRFLEIGYQRELTYRHIDGSFSTFGERENYKGPGSTWLTAYVARSFRQAAEYTHVDEHIIKTALAYLANATQDEDGSFKELGSSFNYGDSKDGAALTAFTVLAFLENEKEYPEYKEVISKALNFLAKTTEASNDLYTNAIASYVLQRAKHDSKDSLLKKLDTGATIDDDRKFWKKIEKTDDHYWYYHPRSVNVEMTAYALLAFLEADRTEDSLPILKWLISQRNSKGGFSSTQDTVVGLHALTKFAEKYSAKENKIEVGIKGDEGVEGKLTVNPDNAIVLQTYEVPSNSKKISLTSTGQGVALVQVAYRFNLNYTELKPSFVITPKVDGTHSGLKISACTNYIPTDGSEKSNMALMEINLPSGFTVDTDSITTLKGTKGVKRVETKKADTVVVVYFDNLDKNEICVSVNADKTHKVANQKPAPIIVYDYYDNSRQARVFYEAPESSLCDICEGDDCGKKCATKEEP